MSEDSQTPFVFKEIIVVPGTDVTDIVTNTIESTSKGASDVNVSLGAGLFSNGDTIIATKAGILGFNPPSKFYVLSSQSRYIPSVGDTVVGTILNRQGEHYKVDIHGSHIAKLHVLGFDGADKRKKPELKPGMLIFGTVLKYDPESDIEITCKAPTSAPGLVKDYTSSERVYGELVGGTLLTVSTGFARRLLDPTSGLLRSIGSTYPFELAVGLNGKVWVRASDIKSLNVLSIVLQNSEFVSDEESKEFVRKVYEIANSSVSVTV